MKKVRGFAPGMLVSAFALSLSVQAAEPTAPTPTKEARATMAAAHEKMATCLRSDRPFAECRTEMQKSAPMMQEHGCQMMDSAPKPK
jgi:hypothetical protein